ncbi:hypothetical protein PORY_001235 [Pneumocystis oryctolagi]|uniref:Uncharacterized protein n=1 Tax=Pneumocystis oryctolagi TaxID=42067 RepID=A0ACB7CDD7_9ASCO|nr:hypothetical protein PORY_001235 [Pneumocystis oryctolagi]
MTRSVKTVRSESGRYFSKHGFEGTAPNGTKKNGAGKANWGIEGSEVDLTEFKKIRRSSNPQSSSHRFLDLDKFSREDPLLDAVEMDD